MREITARALAGAVGGILVHEGDAPSVEHISLDSRKMAGNDLFVRSSGNGQTDMIISAWPLEMVQRQCLPAVINRRGSNRKLSLPSAKGTKKKKQRQKQAAWMCDA